MNSPFKIIIFSISGYSFLFQSCFLIKIPVPARHESIKDTIHIYHFTLSPNKKLLADSQLVQNLKSESQSAYTWITRQARKHGQNLSFAEHWPENKDSDLKNTFIYKLPTNNLTILLRGKNGFRRWVRKTVENEKKRTVLLNWRENLFRALASSVKDSAAAKAILLSQSNSKTKQHLMVIHLIKAKKSKVLGFYASNAAFIGRNKSSTIAHESIHHLGAPDLYIHKYWFGRRRRFVKNQLPDEIMNNTKSSNCNYAYLSNYTAYCMGWDEDLEAQYRPLARMNLQAIFNFMFWLK